MYFAKGWLLYSIITVGKPVQFDLVTINRTRTSCARIKVLVDLKEDFPKSVIMNIVNGTRRESRNEVVHIQYDYVPKYYNECKMQGHDKDECRSNTKIEDIRIKIMED